MLLSLARRGDRVTQKVLDSRLGIEAPTLVRTLDWLEGEGFVARRPVLRDRRAKTIHLTETARPMVLRIEAEAGSVRAEILADIPEADLAACLAVLQRVAEGLARTEEGPSSGYRPG